MGPGVSADLRPGHGARRHAVARRDHRARVRHPVGRRRHATPRASSRTAPLVTVDGDRGIVRVDVGGGDRVIAFLGRLLARALPAAARSFLPALAIAAAGRAGGAQRRPASADRRRLRAAPARAVPARGTTSPIATAIAPRTRRASSSAPTRIAPFVATCAGRCAIVNICLAVWLAALPASRSPSWLRSIGALAAWYSLAARRTHRRRPICLLTKYPAFVWLVAAGRTRPDRSCPVLVGAAAIYAARLRLRGLARRRQSAVGSEANSMTARDRARAVVPPPFVEAVRCYLCGSREQRAVHHAPRTTSPASRDVPLRRVPRLRPRLPEPARRRSTTSATTTTTHYIAHRKKRDWGVLTPLFERGDEQARRREGRPRRRAT